MRLNHLISRPRNHSPRISVYRTLRASPSSLAYSCHTSPRSVGVSPTSPNILHFTSPITFRASSTSIPRLSNFQSQTESGTDGGEGKAFKQLQQITPLPLVTIQSVTPTLDKVYLRHGGPHIRVTRPQVRVAQSDKFQQVWGTFWNKVIEGPGCIAGDVKA